jgi:hypothetical protein
MASVFRDFGVKYHGDKCGLCKEEGEDLDPKPLQSR